PVSKSRHIARSVPMYRTTRSCTAHRQGLWGRVGMGRLLSRPIRDSGLVEEAEVPLQPCPAPPLPSTAMALTRARQVAPHLLLPPVADVREAATRVTERTVLDPAPQNGIDTRNHLRDRPRPIPPNDGLACLQQRRPLLDARRPPWHPSASPTANATE